MSIQAPAAPVMPDQVPAATDDGRPSLDRDAALHGILGEVVRTLEPHTEADPVALLADLLTSFGNVVGPGPHAFADGAKHPARVSHVLVGGTSRGRKGTARSNVRRLFVEVDKTWDTKQVKGGLSTGEGLVSSVRDPSGEDDTGAPVDKRLLVVEPEFSRVLKVAGREGATLSAVIRDAYDSGALSVMTRKDPLTATGSHVSIIGHITPEELRRGLSETEVANGFANRFLFLYVRRSKLLPEGGALPDVEFLRLTRLLRNAVAEARKIGRLTRSEEARVLWATMYKQVAEREDDGLVGTITARAEAQLLRLSVVYALADGHHVIDVVHLRAAWAVWQYAEASARYIWGDSLGDPVADKLLAALATAGERGLTGEQQGDVFSGHIKAKTLQGARDRLSAARLAITVSSPTTGRPTTVTFLSAFAGKAEQAKKGEW